MIKTATLSLIFGLTLIAGAEKPKNVVFISIDDLNTDLGCYGHEQVLTPHMDRLAEIGVRFDRAYCQQPLCGPSRVSVMSGLRPNTTDCFALGDNIRRKRPETVTLGQFFQEKGYYVGRVGKIYHYGNPSQIGTDGNDDALSWKERFNPRGIDSLQEDEIIRYPGGRKGDPDKEESLGISMAWWDPLSADEEHTDGMVATRAIEMITRNQDRPFSSPRGSSIRIAPMSRRANISNSIPSKKSPCRIWRLREWTWRIFRPWRFNATPAKSGPFTRAGA